jgi:hypothetical protein
METSKTTGEIPVVFRLYDEGDIEVATPEKKDKSQNYYQLHFKQIRRPGKYRLFISIDDLGNVVPESKQSFLLNVIPHLKTNCVPCLSASLDAGKTFYCKYSNIFV